MDWKSETTKKYIAEAEAVGLTLLGPGKSSRSRLYRLNECGHKQEAVPSNIRRHRLRCFQCLQDKLIKDAKAVGLTLLGPGRNKDFRLYRFNSCGHKQQIGPANVRINNFKCESCFQNKLAEEAKDAGLTLLGPGRNKNYRLYRFNNCKHEQNIGTGHVREKKNFKCNSCLQAKLIAEASAAGLTLLDDGKDFNYRLYQFNECGHKREFTLSAVRAKGFRCDVCLQAKLISEASAVNLTLLGPGRSQAYRLYRFDDCLHEQDFQPTNVRRTHPQCDRCSQDQLEEEARAAGLTLLGPAKSKHYRLYRFNNCEHEQNIRIDHVREKKNFKCRLCSQEKLISEARAAGLTILGRGKNHQYRLYRVNACGHEQVIQTTNVRRASFLCDQCEETSLDLPSHVYLLEIQVGKESWLKLGYAKVIDSRIQGYGLPKGATTRELEVVPYETGREARTDEESLHKKYSRRRLPVKRMKKFHTKNGFRECYPMTMLDTLMDELSSLKP